LLKERNKWERIRWQTYYLLNVHLDKKSKVNKLTDLLTLIGEKEETDEMDEATRKHLEERFRDLKI
jgi:hypothetical protein